MGQSARREDTTPFTSTAPAPLYQQIQSAQMSEMARTFEEWRDQNEWTQIEAAARIRTLLPPDLKRGMSNANLSRWQNPKSMRSAKFVVVLAMCHAFGHTIQDLTDRLFLTQLRVVANQPQEQHSDAQAAYLSRREREAELVEGFRSLPTGLQNLIQAQVKSLAKANLVAPVDDELDFVPELAAGYQLQTAGARLGTRDEDAEFEAAIQRIHEAGGVVEPEQKSRKDLHQKRNA
jgi:hypothetical protein